MTQQFVDRNGQRFHRSYVHEIAYFPSRMPDRVLIYFHCRADTGYAIGRLEQVFYQMALRISGLDERVFFAYTSTDGSIPTNLPSSLGGVSQIDPTTQDSTELTRVTEYVRSKGITIAVGFDQQPGLPIYRALRRGGVTRIVAYWGAPMSSLNPPWKVLLKRLEVALRPSPDFYIFESVAMQATAVNGRGIARRDTAVVYLGVDEQVFRPATNASRYAHELFGIPREAYIVFYSGHMEARKGVGVIIEAAKLIASGGRRNVYFLLLGNKAAEADSFSAQYVGSNAEQFIKFGGYRDDISCLMQCASVGVIASTRWDSFTRSAVEMASTGLPLIVSRLQGLVETIDEGVTGVSFEPGNAEQLASIILRVIDSPDLSVEMGVAARKRVIDRFTERRQIIELAKAVCPQVE